ncbi:hypothetical protein THRCLA_05676 [Thraustotheca clavata]|uniref:Macro domain-containing protein n=1 Tax=Thraustotheca clavata TaxID=74557 RepID=A0A1V9ZV85_9STRA|nr:hypothetical protein THRCLA_05676 [Thraustotheca clavata]
MEVFLNQDICMGLLKICPVETVYALCVVLLSNDQLRSCGAAEVLWNQLIQLHFGNSGASYTHVALPMIPLLCRKKMVADGSLEVSKSCREFMETCIERNVFASMSVIKGDIGQVTNIGTKKLDCLIFPTNSSLISFGIGAAGAVFNRAGAELPTLLRSPTYRNIRRYTSDAVATPGFKSGVDHLIHCVGPSTNRPDCCVTLYRTYYNAFQRAREIGAICIAVASISTGSLGFPVPEAARIAMRAYRDYIKAYRWRALLCFVCLDNRVYDAMQAERSVLLHHFNKGSVELP